MFSHVFVGITDFDCALAFYAPLMRVLGIQQRFCEPDRPWAGWQSQPVARPLFVIAHPHNAQAPEPGNGTMVAFLAVTRSMVQQAYDVMDGLAGKVSLFLGANRWPRCFCCCLGFTLCVLRCGLGKCCGVP